MGMVITPNGTQVAMEEVEGKISLLELYQEAKCEHYTVFHRVKMIEACGKLGRLAWGVLHSLQDMAKGSDPKLSKAAQEAVKKIDPGMPALGGFSRATPTQKTSTAPATNISSNIGS